MGQAEGDWWYLPVRVYLKGIRPNLSNLPLVEATPHLMRAQAYGEGSITGSRTGSPRASTPPANHRWLPGTPEPDNCPMFNLRNRSSDDSSSGTRDSIGPDPNLEPSPSDLSTPVSPTAIAKAREEHSSDDRDATRDLVDVLNSIQMWIDNHEYVDRPGNAFFEQLVEDFNDNSTLREPVLVDGDELVFVLLAEGWAEIQAELDLMDEEVTAARDAHQLHAREKGLAEYTPLVNVMAVRTTTERVTEIVEQTDAPLDGIQLAPLPVDYPKELTDTEPAE